MCFCASWALEKGFVLSQSDLFQSADGTVLPSFVPIFGALDARPERTKLGKAEWKKWQLELLCLSSCGFSVGFLWVSVSLSLSRPFSSCKVLWNGSSPLLSTSALSFQYFIELLSHHCSYSIWVFAYTAFPSLFCEVSLQLCSVFASLVGSSRLETHILIEQEPTKIIAVKTSIQEWSRMKDKAFVQFCIFVHMFPSMPICQLKWYLQSLHFEWRRCWLIDAEFCLGQVEFERIRAFGMAEEVRLRSVADVKSSHFNPLWIVSSDFLPPCCTAIVGRMQWLYSGQLLDIFWYCDWVLSISVDSCWLLEGPSHF